MILIYVATYLYTNNDCYYDEDKGQDLRGDQTHKYEKMIKNMITRKK